MQSVAVELEVNIRWMIRRDTPDVMAIESACHDFPLCEDELLRMLEQRTVIAMVAVTGETIVGYMVYELHKDSLELLNLCVRPDSQRRGVGRQLIAKLKSKLSPVRRSRLWCRARESQSAFHYLCRDQEIQAIGVLRQDYEDSQEDAYLFEFRSPGEQDMQSRKDACWPPAE